MQCFKGTLKEFKRKKKIDLILRHLKSSLASRALGVNILLYGPPGTGKTELSRYLAKALKCSLYDVGDGRSCRKSGALFSLEGEERLSSIRYATTLLNQYVDRWDLKKKFFQQVMNNEL